MNKPIHSPRLYEISFNDVDNWLGLADSRRRRKIQNRINQRTYRAKKRQAVLTVDTEGATAAACTQLVPASTGVTWPPGSAGQTSKYGRVDLTEAIVRIINLVKILEPRWEGNQLVLQRFEAFATSRCSSRLGALDILPSLSQFHFVKALFANMEVLGLSDEEMEDEALSPFNRLRGPLPLQEELTGKRFTTLPTALQPTELQNAIPHHPWIDLLPLPTMRDNIFRRGFDSFDEEELCHAMRGHAPTNNPGLLVWRDPWDSTSWEVTEEFIGSWGWVVEGCADLLRSTNIWRARRGEKPLFLPVP
ncbi:hypothetical protein ACEPPN_004214 [Leptodophora sp. 'Broadleaf-Isolate-01']